MSIHDVRPTDDFYRDLDRALTRAGEDAISRSNFGLYVLPGILHRFAVDWDDLPRPIPGRSDYRVHLGHSVHLGFYGVEGQIAADGVIELTSLSVDPVGLIDPDEPPGDNG